MLKKSKLSKLLSAVLAFGMMVAMLPTAMAETTTVTLYPDALYANNTNRITEKNYITRKQSVIIRYVFKITKDAASIPGAKFNVPTSRNDTTTWTCYVSKKDLPTIGATTDAEAGTTSWADYLDSTKNEGLQTAKAKVSTTASPYITTFIIPETLTVETGDTIIIKPHNPNANFKIYTPAYSDATKHPTLTYTISDEVPTFALTGKAVTETITANEAVTATATFTNTTENAENVCVIVALYEQSGRMIGVDFTETTVAAQAGEGVEVSAELTAPQTLPTGAYAKAFVWNSISGMKPIELTSAN